jgi:hypothetical protein
LPVAQPNGHGHQLALYFGCQNHLRGTTSVLYVDPLDKGKNIGFLIIDFDSHDICTFLSAPSSDTTLPCGVGKLKFHEVL